MKKYQPAKVRKRLPSKADAQILGSTGHEVETSPKVRFVLRPILAPCYAHKSERTSESTPTGSVPDSDHAGFRLTHLAPVQGTAPSRDALHNPSQINYLGVVSIQTFRIATHCRGRLFGHRLVYLDG